MSLCLYVSMSLCLYVSMSLCLYVSMSLCLYAFMSLCLHVSMSPCLYVSMSLCLYVSMSLCLYVSMSLCLISAADRPQQARRRPPEGLRRATNRPKAIAAAIGAGTLARARRVATSETQARPLHHRARSGAFRPCSCLAQVRSLCVRGRIGEQSGSIKRNRCFGLEIQQVRGQGCVGARGSAREVGQLTQGRV